MQYPQHDELACKYKYDKERSATRIREVCGLGGTFFLPLRVCLNRNAHVRVDGVNNKHSRRGGKKKAEGDCRGFSGPEELVATKRQMRKT